MKIIKDLLNYNIEFNKNQLVYEINEFPHFPDDSESSLNIFNEIEILNFRLKNIELPISVNVAVRTKEIKLKDLRGYTLWDIFDFIKKDEVLFVDTSTFFKIELNYIKKKCIIKIIYYTVCEDGERVIQDYDDLLDTIKVRFKKRKFLKKFVENKKIQDPECPNYLEYIPLIPLQWLEYDANSELMYMDYFVLIDKNIELPF